LGVGIGIIGPVEKKKGISKKAYGVWKLEINVIDYFEQKLGYKVVVENNVKVYMIAEMLYGKGRKVENLLVLKWGLGIGKALVVNEE